jgi:polar amino acid transport system substrate-binding protein
MAYSKILGVIVGFALTAGIAHADQLSDIKQRGSLICGTMGTFEPFSFSDPKTREVVGYEVDLCRAIADQLGVKMELKLLAVEARIPELAQGRVDILSAALSYSDQRAQQIDFTNTSFVSRVMAMVPVASSAKTLWDLDGKRISGLKGSTTEGYIPAIIPKATLHTFQDASSAFLSLQQSRVDAIALAELPELRLINQTNQAYRTVEPAMAVEGWALGVRKGEPAFKDAVNAAMAKIETSGAAQAMFDKWLGTGSTYKMERHFKLTDKVGNAEIAKPNKS